MDPKTIWLFVFVGLYWTYCLFWGIKGALTSKTATDYMIAGRGLGLWVFVLAATATSFSGWTFMGHPGLLYRDGFQYAYASFYAITIPFTGVLFLKRQWMLGKRYGFVTPGEMLAALALIVLSAFEAVQPLPQAMETLSSSGEAGSRLMEILDAEPAVIDPADPAPLPSGVSIQVSGLAFRYPGSEGYALDGIDFQLQEGELLAVVGPSGSGKSTLANLLLRFWGNYLGRISLGGGSTSLTDLSQQELRERISAVPQNPELFQYTLESNIRLGLLGATREQVTAAAHWSKLDDLIAQLPDGLDTWLGERGQRFSAGEGQRIAVARAVLKDAPLFILDEPTANLDPITERELMENLLQLLKGKTTLLITHRLVGLGQADRILVLDGGRITEQGTEDELLDQGGLYRTMWLSQNRILCYS